MVVVDRGGLTGLVQAIDVLKQSVLWVDQLQREKMKELPEGRCVCVCVCVREIEKFEKEITI